MASRKPWRTVILREDTGRFTREQIDAAIERVKKWKARRAAAQKVSDSSKKVD